MRKLLCISTLVIMLCACRVNNGDIGDFFGSWLLYSITIDGEDAPGFNPEETYWEFQNNIIEISRVDDRLHKQGRWGTWTDSDDRLLLDFTHGDDDYAPGTDFYQAPEWIYMPANQIIDLHFVERKSNRMTLDRIDHEGKHITYALRKIW